MIASASILLRPTIKPSPFRLKFPSFWKRRINDCGPCCLEMVAHYYGIKVDMQRLRRLTGLRLWGTTLLSLSKAAEQLGFITLNVQISLDALSNVRLPCIAHIRDNHFVVVQYVEADEVWLADPAAGCLQMPKDLFCAQSKGIALLLFPASRLAP